MPQDISDKYVLCTKGKVVPLSPEKTRLVKEALEVHFKDFTPHTNFDKLELKPGKSGAVPGGRFKDPDSGDEYYYKQLISGRTFPNQGLHDYMLGALYKRILFDRAPTNNIFKHSDGTKIEDSFVTSKILKYYDGPNPSPTLGLAKAMAAAIFMNEQDFRDANLVRIESGHLAKIDHGRSVETHLWKVHEMTKKLSIYQKTVDWCRIAPIEFLDCLKQIIQISDDEIEYLIFNRAQFLKANGWNEDAEANAESFVADLKKNRETCREYLERADALIEKYGNDVLKTLTLVEVGDINNIKIYELAKEIGLTSKGLRKMYSFCFKEEDRLKLFEELKALVDEYGIDSANLPTIFWQYDSKTQNKLCKIAKLFGTKVEKIIDNAHAQYHDCIIQEALFYAIKESEDPRASLEQAKLSKDVLSQLSIRDAQFFIATFNKIEGACIEKEFVTFKIMCELSTSGGDLKKLQLKEAVQLLREYNLGPDSAFLKEIGKRDSLENMKKFFSALKELGIEIKDLEFEGETTVSRCLKRPDNVVQRVKLLKENGITKITRDLLTAREDKISELIEEKKKYAHETSGLDGQHESLLPIHDDAGAAAADYVGAAEGKAVFAGASGIEHDLYY